MSNRRALELFHCDKTNCKVTEHGCKKRWYKARDPHRGASIWTNSSMYSPCRTCDKWGQGLPRAVHHTEKRYGSF